MEFSANNNNIRALNLMAIFGKIIIWANSNRKTSGYPETKSTDNPKSPGPQAVTDGETLNENNLEV